MTTLPPPPLPNPLPSLEFTASLHASGANGLSIPQKGNFMGWSIELSVANQFLARNSTRLHVPFLNYINNIKARAGAGPTIRVGGNTQELTELFFTPFNSHYEIIDKTVLVNTRSPTGTPQTNIWIDFLYTLGNITALTSANWYLGLPFGYPVNVTGIVSIAEISQQVLGDSLLALQLGNEPDLFGAGLRGRPTSYTVKEYMAEFSNVTNAMLGESSLLRQKILVGPSTCCEVLWDWRISDVLSAGYLSTYSESLSHLAVQRYPTANCPGSAPEVTEVWPNYLRHDLFIVNILTSNVAAVAANIPLIMFETNTASCAGYSGLSDSFGAALWAVDWTMQLAYQNFSGALFHFGGQNAAYNAFTPPPSSYSSLHQWTTGPLYYSMLMVAEALGATNTSQVVDMRPNDNNPYTPGYAIYENGVPARVLLINYMDDLQTGNATYTASVQFRVIDDLTDTAPMSVQVRYLAAPSVSEKFNITWGGQSMGGGQFVSDGRLSGSVVTQTVQCSADKGCPITVPAPGAALVFMSAQAEDESWDSSLTQTYATSVYPHGIQMNPDGLVMSNGRGGPKQAQHPLGLGTSRGRSYVNASPQNAEIDVCTILGAIVSSGTMIYKALRAAKTNY
ncbi:hypothetical protein DL93DRAFT_2193867 [Clavulina sp. PMI_390]|nr:hypothetical protein DL93DRAFT_2193867 [Clavulina sp. PMI_390]